MWKKRIEIWFGTDMLSADLIKLAELVEEEVRLDNKIKLIKEECKNRLDSSHNRESLDC